MTIDFGAHVSAAGGLDLALTRANDFGMAACQVFTKSERQWAAKPLDPAIVQRFHEYAAVYEIKHLVAHDSYLINIASPNDELREKSIAALIHELERCDALNIPHLVSHPGAHMGEGPDYGVDRVADAINRIHAAMPEGRAIILIETTAGQGTAMGRSFDEIGAMIDLLVDKSRIGVCMDTCHIFAAGYELRDPDGYATTMSEFADKVGFEYLKCLHLNDSQKGLGLHVDRHAHIGQGEIGDAGFANVVNDERLFGLPGILETPKEAPAFEEDKMNLDKLKSLMKVA